ncbi:cysteine proteinase [Periconia macrospinosa]|uniref:Cysteine proteinase n=1 Tax=Periconia macrospinosa TaxID=97972 RepID=A0A2V1E920_9PLEO|nr:cysteine proteinase [Periconia macrospinosa]
MGDQAREIETLKAAASKRQSQLQSAPKKEALELAVSAAEHLMKAMRLSSDPGEKKDLKSQFSAAIDLADHIKSSPEWPPSHQSPHSLLLPNQNTSLRSSLELSSKDPTPSKNAQVTSWAANVPQTGGPAHMFNENVVQMSSSLTSITPSARSDSQTINEPTSEISLSTSSTTSHEQPLVVDGVYQTTETQLPSRDALRTTPSIAPYSHIRKLAEPVSTRKRSKKEEIILLKSSVVNGFKCPPWDKTPVPSEFAKDKSIDLFVDTRDLSLSTFQQQYFLEWARPNQAVPPPSVISGDRNGLGPLMSTARSIDLVQDAATDCSVVASLCAGIARAERGHDQLLSNKLYPFDRNLGRPVISPNGKYIVRLNFNGCWRKVVIDDRLPMSNSHRLLHVIDRRQPALLWPALIEKAYLKVRGGYDFPGSNSCSDLWTMTGWIPEQIHLQETDTVPNQLWDRLYRAFMYGDVLVTLGTGQMSSRQEREFGLEGQHSYVVLDMKETDHDKLLLVKNPWVEGRGWRGPRPPVGPVLDTSTTSGESKNSTEGYHLDSIPSKERPHPTTFYIGLEQVIRHFESLYLNWNPGLFRHRQDIHFDWKIEATGGDSTCIVEHPQFSFWSKDGEIVWFLLTRHFRDAPDHLKDVSDAFNDGSIRPDAQMNSAGDPSLGYMSIYVCAGGGNRLYVKDTYLESSDYVTTPQCLLRWDTDPHSYYTVVIDQEDLPASSYSFTLSAFSNSEIALEPAIQKYPFQQSLVGAWTKHTAGGSTSSANYFENPQYLLEVKKKGPFALLLTSTDKKNPMHIKLALGYGKRVYRLQSRDVLVDSGDHRTRCVFAETDGLPPGLYTIICSLFEAGQTGDFTLRVDSTEEVVVKPIPRDGAGLIYNRLSLACFGPEVNKIAAPIIAHRLASYTIVARFQKATTPRARAVLPASRSPFRFSVEEGRGPERKFLITSEDGEYADSAIVRSEARNIDPTLYKPGDLWLVLDRLSGPGGPVEEWYDMEVFTDVPQAFTIGVWRNWDD